MANTLPDINIVNNVYLDLYALTGITPGKPIIINNKTSGAMMVQIKPTQPLGTDNSGLQILGAAFMYIDAGESRVWLRGQSGGRINVQEAD